MCLKPSQQTLSTLPVIPLIWPAWLQKILGLIGTRTKICHMNLYAKQNLPAELLEDLQDVWKQGYGNWIPGEPDKFVPVHKWQTLLPSEDLSEWSSILSDDMGCDDRSLNKFVNLSVASITPYMITWSIAVNGKKTDTEGDLKVTLKEQNSDVTTFEELRESYLNRDNLEQ